MIYISRNIICGGLNRGLGTEFSARSKQLTSGERKILFKYDFCTEDENGNGGNGVKVNRSQPLWIYILGGVSLRRRNMRKMMMVIDRSEGGYECHHPTAVELEGISTASAYRGNVTHLIYYEKHFTWKLAMVIRSTCHMFPRTFVLEIQDLRVQWYQYGRLTKKEGAYDIEQNNSEEVEKQYGAATIFIRGKMFIASLLLVRKDGKKLDVTEAPTDDLLYTHHL